jgi:hypothetical protein
VTVPATASSSNSATGKAPGADVRVWVLAVALVSFATGLVVGVVIPELFAAEQRLDTPQEEAEFLTTKYGLSKDQYRRLVMVFEEHYRVDWNILKSANPNQFREDLRSQRLLQSRKTEQRVRFVLDEQQRALYDRDSTNLSPGASGSTGEQENR